MKGGLGKRRNAPGIGNFFIDADRVVCGSKLMATTFDQEDAIQVVSNHSADILPVLKLANVSKISDFR